MAGFGNERICPVCGKLYYLAKYNKYKVKGLDAKDKYKKVNVCSYGCMRKIENGR